MNALLKIALFGIGFAILIFIVLAVWISIGYRPVVKDVSEKRPFSDSIGNPVELKRTAYLGKTGEEHIKGVHFTVYEYEKNFPEKNETYTLAEGTKITFTLAKTYKTPAGPMMPYFIGNVYVEELGGNVTFEYQWGDIRFNINKGDKDPTMYLEYPLSIWQNEPLQEKFPEEI